VLHATVDELVETVRGFLRDEAERASSLNARGTGLTGFVGIILSVAAAVGATGSNAGTGLHHSVRVTAGVLIAAALLILGTAVLLVVIMVLRPTEGKTVHIKEIERYPNFEFLSQERVIFQGNLLTGLVEALRIDRERNNLKADWLRRAYYAVCVALALVALAGIAATLDRYVSGGKGTDQPRHEKPGHGRGHERH
jgi:hypothetical protein